MCGEKYLTTDEESKTYINIICTFTAFYVIKRCEQEETKFIFPISGREEVDHDHATQDKIYLYKVKTITRFALTAWKS